MEPTRRDFLKAAGATAILAATGVVHASEAPALQIPPVRHEMVRCFDGAWLLTIHEDFEACLRFADTDAGVVVIVNDVEKGKFYFEPTDKLVHGREGRVAFNCVSHLANDECAKWASWRLAGDVCAKWTISRGFYMFVGPRCQLEYLTEIAAQEWCDNLVPATSVVL